MAVIGELENKTYRRLGILLILMGAAFAAATYLGLPFIYSLWPLLSLSLGIGFIGIFIKRHRGGSFYLGTGVYLAQFSLLALYCNFTSWSILSSLWPVFIAFLGVVFAVNFIVVRRNHFVLFLGVLSFLLAGFFMLVFNVDTDYWWMVFVVVGVSVLVTGRRS
jgi:hypothetical protein